MRLYLYIILLVVLFVGCEKQKPIEFLNPNGAFYGYDAYSGIIVYNGISTTLINGELVIGENHFNIQTDDPELLPGKAYVANANGETFQLYYTNLPHCDHNN